MIDREDISFATCYQLAQLISSDWENPPEEINQAIEALYPLDEPGEVFFGVPIATGTNPLKLTLSEKEPESIRNSRKIVELKIAINIFKIIMKHSDGWETPDSDVIKKEILSRISNYESEIKHIITPLLIICDIKL